MTLAPSLSVVLPGTSGLFGSPMYAVKVPPPSAPPPPPEPLSSPPPPQADSSIAPVRPVAMSAAERLLNLTCNASLVPLCGGNGLVRRQPGVHGRAAGVVRTQRTMPVRAGTLGAPREGVHDRHRLVTSGQHPTGWNRTCPQPGPPRSQGLPPGRGSRRTSSATSVPACQDHRPRVPRSDRREEST